MYIIYGASRGFNIQILALLCAIRMILSNGVRFFDSLIGEKLFINGPVGFAINFFAGFALGTILAKYSEASGVALSIANMILKLTGNEESYPESVGLF